MHARELPNSRNEKSLANSANMNQSRELKRKSDSYFAEFADEFYYTLLANEMPNNRN